MRACIATSNRRNRAQLPADSMFRSASTRGPNPDQKVLSSRRLHDELRHLPFSDANRSSLAGEYRLFAARTNGSHRRHQGNVADASGAAVSGADRRSNKCCRPRWPTDRHEQRRAYRFPSLIPGTYTITIKKQAFANSQEKLPEWMRERRSYRREVAGRYRERKVEVTGEAPLLQTDSAEVSETIHS